MDKVASAIVDLAYSEKVYPSAMNILHSNPVPWNTVMEFIVEVLEEQKHKHLSLISLDEWVEILEKISDEKYSDVVSTPSFYCTASMNTSTNCPVAGRQTPGFLQDFD